MELVRAGKPEVGVEFHEIDPEAVRLLEEVVEPALEPVGLF